MALNAALVDSARRGDEKALRDLLATYQGDMRRIANSQCASASDADDAVQESLWLVYQKIGALRTITAFPGWVFSIIKRECHRLLRGTRKCTELPPEDDLVFAYREHPALRADLVAAIQSLPPKYREAIVLRDVEQLSVDDIAQKLNLTRDAVKSRVHRARTMVRDYFSD